MSVCIACKKFAEISWWDRTRYDLMCRLFPQDVKDIRSEAHSRGVGDGYKLGFKAAQHIPNLEEQTKFVADLAKGELEDWLQPYSDV